MFRFFALVGIVGVACISAGALRYRAVDIGVVPNTGSGNNVPVCGVGSDGSVAYFNWSSKVGTGIYANGQFRTLEQITGVPFSGYFRLRSKDYFCFGQNQPAYFQFGDGYVWETGTSQYPFASGGGMSVTRGEWTFYREQNPTLFESRARAYVNRGGVESEIPAFGGNTVMFPIDMNEEGWIIGGTNRLAANDPNYDSWVLAPGSLTPTLIPVSSLRKAYRVGNDGYVYGAGNLALSRYSIVTGEIEDIRGPNGTFLFAEEPFDVNGLGQVVCDKLRPASGMISQHRTIALWQNGASEYLEDILVNPELLPAGGHMRGLGINDAGQIATSIQMSDGRYHLIRCDPVPEPATYLALGLGLAAIVRRRRR